MFLLELASESVGVVPETASGFVKGTVYLCGLYMEIFLGIKFLELIWARCWPGLEREHAASRPNCIYNFASAKLLFFVCFTVQISSTSWAVCGYEEGGEFIFRLPPEKLTHLLNCPTGPFLPPALLSVNTNTFAWWGHVHSLDIYGYIARFKASLGKQ